MRFSTQPLRSSVVVGAAVLGGLVAGGGIGPAASGPTATSPQAGTGPVAGFSSVVYVSHVNDPRRTPLFPGDPRFVLQTRFTVREDGFLLKFVKEGEHTGTHWASPCHFHAGARCADDLPASSLILPAVVVDVRDQVRRNVHYRLKVADLEAWQAQFGPMPAEAAVIAWTGCDRFWSVRERGRNYFNCGSGRPGVHQPGFSRAAVTWLIERGILGERGALGTDTFGPDPSTDLQFRESSMVLRRSRIDLENLTNLDALPPVGAWVAVGGPRNRNGSGSPGTVFGLIP
jgi:kynurenine formamidase